MKTTIATLVTTLFFTAAFATEKSGHVHNNRTTSTNVNANAAAIGLGGSATGGAGGFGGQGGGGGQGGSAFGGTGGSVGSISNTFTFSPPPSTTYAHVETGGTSTVRNNPAIGFQAAPATANCMNNVGLGGGGTGGSALISFNFSVDWCVKTYLSEKARDAGKVLLAEELFCSVPEVKELNSEDCKDASARIAKAKGE